MLMAYPTRSGGKLSNALLGILKAANGDWLTRADLAERFGRRIQPYDIAVLDKMAEDGIIEKREALVGQVKTRWEYRVKQGRN
jgi:hypothetical protein